MFPLRYTGIFKEHIDPMQSKEEFEQTIQSIDQAIDRIADTI